MEQRERNGFNAGVRLQAIRAYLRVTKTEFLDTLNHTVTLQTVSNWEKLQRLPDSAIKKLAGIENKGINIEYVIYKDAPMLLKDVKEKNAAEGFERNMNELINENIKLRLKVTELETELYNCKKTK